MHVRDRPCSHVDLSHALALMREALDILDEVEVPGTIGSALDLSISRLAEMLGGSGPVSGGAQSLLEQLERELSRSGPNGPDRPCPWEKPQV